MLCEQLSHQKLDSTLDNKCPDSSNVSCNGPVSHLGNSGLADQSTGRYFATGAYRDTDAGKNDYEGYLSPLVIEAFGDYMTRHRLQSDGHLRDSDNWQQGIPREQYMKSLWRHFLDLWKEHRGYPSRDGIDEAICGLLFNAMGYYHELLKERLCPRG